MDRGQIHEYLTRFRCVFSLAEAFDRERQTSQAHSYPERLMSRRSFVVLQRDERSCYGFGCLLQSEAKISWSEVQSTMIETPLLR